MNYRNDGLIDISLNVDMSALKERLDEFEEKLDGADVADKVREAIDGMLADGTVASESYVGDLIDEKIGEIDLSDKLDEYVKSDDIDDMIRDYVSSNSLMDSSDVDSAIESALEDQDLNSLVRDAVSELGLDPDEVADADDLEKLTERVTALEADEGLNEKVLALQEQVETLTHRLDVLAERNATALDFFGLIQQAFNLLKRGGA